LYAFQVFRFRVFKQLGKIFALIAATLTLPMLAYISKAGTDNGQGNDGQNNGKQNGHHQGVPVVPEVNTGWVLVPVAGAVLLLSWRRFSRAG
jgi:hypothetical protein